MEVGLLGPLRVTENDEEVRLRGAKIRALVAILALHRAELIAAERIVDLLWGDEPPSNPTNALQAQVSVLRRTLGADRIRTVGAAYALELDDGSFDIARFEALVASGRAAAERGDLTLAAAQLSDALALWRGDALSEFAYEDWARAEITRLEELRAAAMDARIDAELALGRDSELIADIEASIEHDRLREHRWAQLMIALYRSGRQADALRAFADARSVLVEELGVDPGPELSDLEARILNQDPSLAPTAVLRTPLRGSLPTPLTTFFGRSRELAAIAAASGDGRRLMTLIGPGGAGKTRVAVEAARAASSADETLLAGFVTLETVTDVDAIGPAIATALGLRREGLPTGGTTDVVDTVAATLGDRRALLVLDNCEHVVDDAARSAERLLLQCPNLRIIATSREALGVTGEHLVAIGSLDQADATALFADRAAAARPSGDVNADTVEITAICERLDGLPLAVELAAARARVLPIPQIAERLADRFRLLTGGSRTAVPRQQTLRAVVDWSYELLFDHERELFARLAVFSGGWTLDAVEAICSDESLPAEDVLDVMTSLVEKSLVVAEPSGRYRMLQTLAEYAQERLVSKAGSAVIRDRHADWYATLAEGADHGLTSADATAWRARLETELDNLRVAFDWLCESAAAEPAQRLANEIALLWWLRGDFADGARWSERAAAMEHEGPLRTVNHAWAAFYAANSTGEIDASLAQASDAADALARSDDLRSLTKARVMLATLRSRRRDPLLERDARAAIATAAEHGDKWYEGVAHALLAMSSVRGGDFDGAVAAAERSVELLDAVDDHALIFEARSVLITIALLTGRPEDAEVLAREQVDIARQARLPQYEEWGLARVGFARAAQGDLTGAVESFDAAIALGAERWADAFAHLGRAICARGAGDPEAAARAIGLALEIQHRIGALTEQAYLHVLAGWIAVDAHDRAAARAAADRATALLPENASVVAMADEVRAAARVADGDPLGPFEQAPATGHMVWIFTRADVARLTA